MKVAFPTKQDQGLQSTVYGHFGSAPHFMVVDSETGAVESIDNEDLFHQHGECQPLKALGGQRVDAAVVGGVGAGALMRLMEAGISVYRAVEGSVEENLELLKAGRLPILTPEQTCSGHDHGGLCAHDGR